jgi:hypothetical protein
MLSVKARTPTPAAAPVEANSSSLRGTCLRPGAACGILRPEANPLPPKCWDGPARANRVRHVEQVRGRATRRAAKAETEKELIRNRALRNKQAVKATADCASCKKRETMVNWKSGLESRSVGGATKRLEHCVKTASFFLSRHGPSPNLSATIANKTRFRPPAPR